MIGLPEQAGLETQTTGADHALASAGGLFTTAFVAMDTVVQIRVVAATGDTSLAPRIERARGWFMHVEAHCSRFDSHSEVMALCREVGRPVPVSNVLFGALHLALEIARLSGGAFDPTVGLALERAGFNREYRTGAVVATPIAAGTRPSYRDVYLDADRQTVTLKTPLVLDLGAVAKGMAIDLAAAELAGYPGYAVYAGGDLFAAGLNERGTAWRVGIMHPRQPGTLLDTLCVSNTAVCTSGDYLRRVHSGDITHHLLDPRTGASAQRAASATVIAPAAMLADALATAAFVLGPRRGIPLLERVGVQGLIITPRIVRKATAGYGEYRAETKVQ